MSGRQGLSPVSAATAATTPSMTPVPAPLALGLRLPVFVAVSALLGVTAHAVAAGMTPSPRATALGLVAVTAVGALHRRREARFESVTALLVVGQAVLHAVLCLDGRLLQVGHHGGPSLAGLYPGSPMLVAHLLAAGVAGWWLARGEAAAWAAARRVLRVVRPERPAAIVVVRPVRTPVRHAPAILSPQVRGLRTRPRRGPPAALAL